MSNSRIGANINVKFAVSITRGYSKIPIVLFKYFVDVFH